jgi:DNA modification methylase
MSEYTILEGDCLKTLKRLSACSIQCCVTSPPYFNLRDYGIAGQAQQAR